MFNTGFCLKPARLGNLDPIDNTHSISGLVYLLDRQTVYMKDFSFSQISGQDVGGM